VENFYETKTHSNTLDNPDGKCIEENIKPGNQKMVFGSILVFILVAGFSSALFYWLKNKNNRNEQIIANNMEINVPAPTDSAAILSHESVDTKSSKIKTEPTSPPKPNTAYAKETNKAIEKKPVQQVIAKNPELMIATIAPGNNATIAGNFVYIALTTNIPSASYIKSIEYNFKDGTSIVNSYDINSLDKPTASQTHILNLPILTNSSKIKVNIYLVDSENYSVTKSYEYFVI
jgi:hypothetical protein